MIFEFGILLDVCKQVLASHFRKFFALREGVGEAECFHFVPIAAMDAARDDLVVWPACIDGVAARALMLAIDVAQSDAAFLADIVVRPLAFHRRDVKRFRDNAFCIFDIRIARFTRPRERFCAVVESFQVI